MPRIIPNHRNILSADHRHTSLLLTVNVVDGEGFVRNMKHSCVSSRTTDDLEVENGSYHFIYDLSLQCIVSSLGPTYR